MDPRWTFFSLDIEISNRCELGCLMCPRSRLVRPSGLMEPDTFMTIVRAIQPMRSRIALSGLGNPLNNPHWPDFVAKYKKTGGQIGLVIHAAHLTPHQRDQLLAVKPSFLEISFPSADQKHYHRLCPTSDYHSARESLVSLAKNPLRRFPIVVVALATQLNPNEETVSKEHWKQFGLTARVLPCHSRAGALKNHQLISSPLTQPVDLSCGLLGIHAFVTWQGKLLACCHDLSGETELGDFHKDGLAVLMERKSKLVSVVNPFSLCARCDDPFRLVKHPQGCLPESVRKRRQALRKLVADSVLNQ